MRKNTLLEYFWFGLLSSIILDLKSITVFLKHQSHLEKYTFSSLPTFERCYSSFLWSLLSVESKKWMFVSAAEMRVAATEM